MTVGESTTDGRRSKPRATFAAIHHLSLLVEASEMEKTAAPETNVSLLSRCSEMCGT